MKSGIAAQAFGVPSTILANRLISEMTTRKAKELGCPVFTQLDIQLEQGIEVTYCREIPGNPPPTFQIAREAVRWAMKKGITELWLACAKPHRPRCERDFNWAVKEADADITIRVCEEVEQHPNSEWLCSDSTQKRTKSWWDWWPREIILLLMPFFVYKRVAGGTPLDTETEERMAETGPQTGKEKKDKGRPVTLVIAAWILVFVGAAVIFYFAAGYNKSKAWFGKAETKSAELTPEEKAVLLYPGGGEIVKHEKLVLRREKDGTFALYFTAKPSDQPVIVGRVGTVVIHAPAPPASEPKAATPVSEPPRPKAAVKPKKSARDPGRIPDQYVGGQ